MAASRYGRVWLWRWRRNPLRRRSDIVEAWVVLAAWVVALVGGLLAGLAAADSVERSAERQRLERRQVTARLVEDVKDRSTAREAADHRVWATVRWTAPDGSTHTDEARVAPTATAGSAVTVWTDPKGEITAEPLTDVETRLHAVSGGILAAACAGGLALGAARTVRLGLDRHRMAQWTAEWARIDTRRGWKTG
ncbi:hypothetical protein [Streptomyces bullii]|uniref:Uncharacterized protein n=1 Tax=Streptomyces bullii TaxID=349910 RepID=A0ABW0UU66_9ACTN